MGFLVTIILGPIKYQSSFAHSTPGPGLRSRIDELLAKLGRWIRSAKRNIGERAANPSSSPAEGRPDDRRRMEMGGSTDKPGKHKDRFGDLKRDVSEATNRIVSEPHRYLTRKRSLLSRKLLVLCSPARLRTCSPWSWRISHRPHPGHHAASSTVHAPLRMQQTRVTDLEPPIPEAADRSPQSSCRPPVLRSLSTAAAA